MFIINKQRFLVAEGAKKWAKTHGFSVQEDNLESYLVTDNAKRLWMDYCTRVIHANIEENHDTVGAICLDKNGSVAAGVSSGGIALKHPGRVGEAAIYGAGCWSQNATVNFPAVACSITGTGEQLIKYLMGYECAKKIYDIEYADEAIISLFTQFLKQENSLSKQLPINNQRYGGLIALKHIQNTNSIEFIYGYTTNSMGLAYCTNTISPKPIISYLPNQDNAGSTFNVCNLRLSLS